MKSSKNEKQKLISHIKNQQTILLFASQLSKQIEKKEIYKIIENILVKTVGVDCFSLHIENDNCVFNAFLMVLMIRRKTF